MTELSYKILQSLQAYRSEDVLAAFELFKETMERENLGDLPELIEAGWTPVKEKPEDNIPFHYLFGNYWIFTEEGREKKIQEAKKKAEIKKEKQKSIVGKKTSMGISKTCLRCPECSGKLYKQRVCPGCKDGRSGYRIRLICEENPDHEILL